MGDSAEPVASARMQGGRLVFVDVLGVVACVAVVLLHTSVDAFHPYAGAGWVRDVLAQSVGVFAVPVFFMLSGMNLLGYRRRYSTKTFFKKRFARAGLAFLAGSVVCYLLYSCFPDSFYGTQKLASGPSLAGFALSFLNNDINDTYWFFYTLLYLYLITPLLSLAAGNRSIMRYLLGLSAFASVILPMLGWFGLDESLTNNLFAWPLFDSTATMYFLLGYYLKAHLRAEPSTSLLVCAFAGSAACMCALTLWANGFFSGELASDYFGRFAGISSPFCVVEAVSLFLLARRTEPALRRLGAAPKRAITLLSGAALGVYLYQMPVINWLSANMEPGSFWVALTGRPLAKCLFVYAVTVAIVLAYRSLIKACKGALRKAGRRGAEGA